ncbi:GNAT family N-acetyltransferase [Nocardiopsis salina]|uniref:GNAT family N-acetyltransferase n=1 Tax=Nocardiopsis salina TaxID=245836 RepID=UPI000345EFD0|nr:GNAT family N-acetyltransferase [Nocardiopsis salina]
MTYTETGRPGTAAPEPAPRVLTVEHDDPRVDGLLAGLLEEYTQRYGADGAAHELSRYPVTEFVAPDGRMVLVELDGEIVAGGAVRPYRADRSQEPGTAEFKRIWTSDRHRRKGLARAVMDALEQAARDLGYTHVVLFTGPSQPEAVGLYERLGYRRLDPAAVDVLPYPKAIPFATEL